MGSVNVTLANGQLGAAAQTEDGVCGLICNGLIDDGYILGTPLLLTRLAGLATAGITKTGNPLAYKQVKEFYDEAGDGAKLYLMLATNAQTISMICDNTASDGAKVLLDYAQGKIKVLGILQDDTEVPPAATTTGINDDVHTAATNMEVMAEAYFAKQMPFRCILGGTSYQGTPGDLTDNTTNNNNRTAILIGDTETGVGAAVGKLLGRIAKIPVQRKVSRVKDGDLNITEAWLGTDALEDVPGDGDVIAGLGYISLTTYPRLTGYFFTGDAMMTAATDDYQSLARGRVIDKAHLLAYGVYVNEVDDEVLIDESGNIDAGYATWLEQQVVNQINTSMTAKKEISAVSCYIDPAQNVLSNGQLNVNVGVTPVGYLTEIDIKLGFKNPAN